MLLPSFIGYVVWKYLKSQGVNVVSLDEGFGAVFLLTWVAIIPFILLAVIAYRDLTEALASFTGKYFSKLYIYHGAYIGVTIAMSLTLVFIVRDYWLILHAAYLWPITAIVVLFWAAPGAFIGGISGWFIWAIKQI